MSYFIFTKLAFFHNKKGFLPKTKVVPNSSDIGPHIFTLHIFGPLPRKCPENGKKELFFSKKCKNGLLLSLHREFLFRGPIIWLVGMLGPCIDYQDQLLFWAGGTFNHEKTHF